MSTQKKRAREEDVGAVEEGEEEEGLYGKLHALLESASHETLKTTIAQMAAGNADIASVLIDLIEQLEGEDEDEAASDYIEPTHYEKSILAVSQEWKEDESKLLSILAIMQKIKADITKLPLRNAMTVLKTSTDCFMHGQVQARRCEKLFHSTLDEIWFDLLSNEKNTLPAEEVTTGSHIFLLQLFLFIHSHAQGLLWCTIFREQWKIPSVAPDINGNIVYGQMFPKSEKLLQEKYQTGASEKT